MKLEEWMKATGQTDCTVAEALGVDRATVSRWRREKRYPSRPQYPKIRELTDGAVRATDFVDPTE